jgi:hypothetical protein
LANSIQSLHDAILHPVEILHHIEGGCGCTNTRKQLRTPAALSFAARSNKIFV